MRRAPSSSNTSASRPFASGSRYAGNHRPQSRRRPWFPHSSIDGFPSQSSRRREEATFRRTSRAQVAQRVRLSRIRSSSYRGSCSPDPTRPRGELAAGSWGAQEAGTMLLGSARSGVDRRGVRDHSADPILLIRPGPRASPPGDHSGPSRTFDVISDPCSSCAALRRSRRACDCVRVAASSARSTWCRRRLRARPDADLRGPRADDLHELFEGREIRAADGLGFPLAPSVVIATLQPS